MGQYQNEQSFLITLPAAFRREVEASAISILQKISPPTVARLEGLAAIATAEGRQAPTLRGAETAFALAAELHRRAWMLKH